MNALRRRPLRPRTAAPWRNRALSDAGAQAQRRPLPARPHRRDPENEAGARRRL